MSEQKQMQLDITGMTCAACSARIEKALNKIDGVEATVNLAMEKATIKYDDHQVEPKQIIEKIEKLGYGVRTEKIELDIYGMTCAACSTRIEKGLNKLNGVTKATVNLATESGTVEYQPGVVNVEDILEKVKRLGYEAKVKEERESKETHKSEEIQTKKRKLYISIALSLPLLYTMVAHSPWDLGLPMPPIFMNPWFQFIWRHRFSLSLKKS